jgi:hypothetical protein
VFQLVAALAKLFLAALAHFQDLHDECMNDKQEYWLVQFITLCADGETASQIKGIDQLREVAWELLQESNLGLERV